MSDAVAHVFYVLRMYADCPMVEATYRYVNYVFGFL